MIILDENISKSQRLLLESWRIRAWQIGFNTGRGGMQDEEIIPWLLQQRRSTFFTRDDDFYDQSLCHKKYCLVCFQVEKGEVAYFVKRLLRHPSLRTQSQRMGFVIRASHTGLWIWERHAQKEIRLLW